MNSKIYTEVPSISKNVLFYPYFINAYLIMEFIGILTAAQYAQ